MDWKRINKCVEQGHIPEFAIYHDTNYVVECTACGEILAEAEEPPLPSEQLEQADNRRLEDAFSFDIYRSKIDGLPVIHINTSTDEHDLVKENYQGPMFRCYINDDTDNPIWNNNE